MLKQKKYQQRSMLLLMPLGLLAIASYALDKRIPIGIDFNLQNILLELSRTLIPGFFAIAIACMVPTFNRFYQLFSVGFNYSFLCTMSLLYYPKIFTQPTAWVIAALVATMFMLPNQDFEQESHKSSYKALLLRLFGVLFVPGLVLISFVVIVKNIEHSILITFTSLFIDSLMSCLFVPIYEIMLTLGFSSILNSLVSLQSESTTINAMLNTITITNLLVLPVLMITRACMTNKYNRLFLVFLALITCLTSKIGSCISVELAILMFLYPGSIVVLCTSTIVTFFIALNLNLPSFTNFYLLYQPDLILKNSTFLQLTTEHYYFMFFSVVLAVMMQIISIKFRTLNSITSKIYQKELTAGRRIYEINEPDLLLIALLKALGGKSNVQSVGLVGNSLILQVYNYRIVTKHALYSLGKKRFDLDSRQDEFTLSLGHLGKVLYQRLKNIVEESNFYSQSEVPLTKQFDIYKYEEQIETQKQIEARKQQKLPKDSNLAAQKGLFTNFQIEDTPSE